MRSGKENKKWPGEEIATAVKVSSVEWDQATMIGGPECRIFSPGCFGLDSNSRPGMECRLFVHFNCSDYSVWHGRKTSSRDFETERLIRVYLLQWFLRAEAATCQV